MDANERRKRAGVAAAEWWLRLHAGPMSHEEREDFVAWLQALSPLLLIAAFVLAYIELKVPGFGLPGVLSIVCFALLLVGQYLAGLAEVPHIVAVALGAALIAVEVFVLPGTLWLGIAGALLVIGGLAAAAHADEGTLPAERSQGSVTYVTGGIGKDESDAMKQAASRYSLAIEMSSPAGSRAEYVSDVKIDIRDQRGATVLSTTSDGPILLANLPPGRYTINAD